MRKYLGINKQTMVAKIKEKLFLGVFADTDPKGTQNTEDLKGKEGDPTPTPNPQPSQVSINIEDLLSKARQEEKTKLYGQIEDHKTKRKELETQVGTLTTDLETKDNKIKELESEVKALKTKKAENDSDEVKGLKSEIEKLNGEIEKASNEKQNIQEIEEKIKAEYEVKLYREQKLREVGDKVIPELVIGLTKEEIDASITKSQERYSQIVGTVLDGVSTQTTTVNPSTTSLQIKDLSMQDIANMTPQEWAEARKKLNLK